MMNRVTKAEAEKAILERFQIAYYKHFNVHLALKKTGDRPDFEVENMATHEKLCVEVTGVYQNESEAKIQYGAVEDWDHFEGSLDDLVVSLNRILDSKAKKSKTYELSSPIILVIYLGSLVFTEKFDIDRIRNRIIISENVFSNIWLLTRNQDDYSPELYQLQ
jgi:hypothetical protein